jgi:hypothetical protein
MRATLVPTIIRVVRVVMAMLIWHVVIVLGLERQYAMLLEERRDLLRSAREPRQLERTVAVLTLGVHLRAQAYTGMRRVCRR